MQSLVLDGKLVVDGAFRTNDAFIYAGGDLVKLSRRAQDPRRCVCAPMLIKC
jgi:pyruvate/2-oxoglutarate dehydrogenase complex dihydrolipoamide dehydrogenase (E3) component